MHDIHKIFQRIYLEEDNNNNIVLKYYLKGFFIIYLEFRRRNFKIHKLENE